MAALRGFSAPFKLAIGLWPIASILLTIPVLAVLYHKRGRLRFASVVWSYLAVLYGLGLVCFTLFPLPEGTQGLGITYGVSPNLHPFAFVGDIEKDGIRAVFQVVANIAFFVPLGFMVRRGTSASVPRTLLFGFAVSLLIECAQGTGLFGLYPYAYRTFDVDDLMVNTLGCAVGVVFAAVVGKVAPKHEPTTPPISHNPSFIRRCVAAAIDMGLVFLVNALVLATAALILWNLPGHGDNPEINRTVGSFGLWISLGLVVVFELLVPAMRDGSTLGGAFVRMSCETKVRHGWRRGLFYLLRTFVFLCLGGLPSLVGELALVPWIAVVTYPFTGGMAYDLVGGTPWPGLPTEKYTSDEKGKAA